MSLLSIIQDAAGRLALGLPTSVIGSTDKTALRLLAMAKEEGKALNRRAAWKLLQREATFVTVAGEAQVGLLPPDIDWIMPETMYDRTLKRQVDGPLSPQEWQALESNLVTRVWPAYRIRGTALLFTPPPAGGSTIALEYITKNWCLKADGTEQSSWLADTDTPVLDEELHTLGVVWRFKWRTGLDYSDDLQNYTGEVMQAIMREGTRPRLSSDGPTHRIGSDALAASRPNVILSSDDSSLLWD